MLKKIKGIKPKQVVGEGIVINELLNQPFLKEVTSRFGKGYYVIANAINLVILKVDTEKKDNKGQKSAKAEASIHIGHSTPSDFNKRKVTITSTDERTLSRFLGLKK